MSRKNFDDNVGTWRATSEPCDAVLCIVIPQTWHATSLHWSGNVERHSSGNGDRHSFGNFNQVSKF